VHEDDRGVQLEPDVKAHGVLPKAAAVNWPLPADRRLDQLVAAANDAGAGTRRNELVAAIVAAAEPNGDLLLQLVLRWRRALVRDVVLDVDPEANLVYLPRYGPGRRKRTAG